MDIIFSLILILIALVVSYFGYMLIFMGAVFLILSILKIIDLKGFSDIFRRYDLLAKKFPFYASIYPLIELFLGACFMLRFLLSFAAILTIFIMSIGSVSLIKHLFSKQKKSCACLGAKIKIPLTRFTLVENLIMLVMAVMILIESYL